MTKYYKAEMDRLLRITTRAANLLFLLPPAALLVFLYRPSKACLNLPSALGPLLVAAVAGATALTAWLARGLAPRGYAVDDVDLLIDRKISPIRIPLREITEISRLPDGLLRGSIRLMGTSGYYGYYGFFWKYGLGRYRAYLTRTKDLVGVRSGTCLYALSPDDPADFIATLNSLRGK